MTGSPPSEKLDGVLGKLVECLAPLTTAPDTAAVAPVKGEGPNLAPQLDRLQALLEDYDSEAGDLVTELDSQAASTEFARPLREIAERIDDFEFDEALALLNVLREGMGPRTTDSATLT